MLPLTVMLIPHTMDSKDTKIVSSLDAIGKDCQNCALSMAFLADVCTQNALYSSPALNTLVRFVSDL